MQKIILIFVNVYETFFSSFFIVSLSCLSLQFVWKSLFFELIFILSSNSFKENCITWARQNTRFISCTLKLTSSNILERKKRSNFACIVRLLSTLSFVITRIRYCSLWRIMMFCIIFVNLVSIWDFVTCSNASNISW
jgi:hypothetical protein